MSSRSGRGRVVGIVVASVLAMIAFASACSNNGEGERCQADNGNDDCLDGLTCIPKGQLVAPYNSADRCCPFNRAQATTQACKQGTGLADAAPPSEGGADGGNDAGDASDGGNDANDAAETSTDAADDAPDAD